MMSTDFVEYTTYTPSIYCELHFLANGALAPIGREIALLDEIIVIHSNSVSHSMQIEANASNRESYIVHGKLCVCFLF